MDCAAKFGDFGIDYSDAWGFDLFTSMKVVSVARGVLRPGVHPFLAQLQSSNANIGSIRRFPRYDGVEIGLVRVVSRWEICKIGVSALAISAVITAFFCCIAFMAMP